MTGWKVAGGGACLGGGGDRGATCLAGRRLGARADVHQQERGQGQLRAQRQAATGGEGQRSHGRRVLQAEARCSGPSAPARPGPARPGEASPPAGRPPSPRTSAARMRRSCWAEGKTGRPRRRHSPSGLEMELSM